MKSLITAACVGTLLLPFLLRNSFKEKRIISQIEKSLPYIQGVLQVDSVRQRSGQKIAKIINRFNANMTKSMRQQIADEIYNMSIKYPNIDVDLICATITHESGYAWNPKAVSNAGAMGLMQIMPNTGKWLAKYEAFKWNSTKETLFNPLYNIRMGSRYLSALIETYDLEGGLAAYNGGITRTAMWLANNKNNAILWAETRNYIPSVLKLYDEFKSSAL
ncbi:MAG: lytic transglycosylase domain-containing protein [bacterium]